MTIWITFGNYHAVLGLMALVGLFVFIASGVKRD